MKSSEFQAVFEQLDELAEAQRSALKAPLRSKGSTNDALALIETQFAADPACGHCRSKRFGTWGHASGLGRYKCKDCGRTFNALTGTPMAQLHKRDAWLAYVRALVDRVSLRKAVKRAKMHLEASFRWRHRFLATARNKRPSLLSGIVEADETLIFKSAKGSHKLVGRAPRKTGTSRDDYDIVLIARDRHKATTDHILYDLECGSFDVALAPRIERDAVLVTDGRQAYIGLTKACGVEHVTVVARAGERVVAGVHI